MKLAEAILEKQNLDKRLELLQARLLRDLEAGRPTAHLLGELQRAANQARDIGIAVAWTEQTSFLSGIPLGSYRIRIDYLLKLADLFEKANQEKADELWNTAHNELKIVQAATWLIDLKVPGAEEDKEDN